MPTHGDLGGHHLASVIFDMLLCSFQIFDNEAKDLEREVCFIDIACDEIPERYYKESEVSKRWGDMGQSQVSIHSTEVCAGDFLPAGVLILQGFLA